MKRYILALGLIAFTATNAGAAIMMGYAPEALSHDAEVIFEGTPVSANTKHLIGDRYVTSVRFRVETRIKGPLSAGDTVSIMSLDWKGRTDLMDFVTAVTKKRKVLVLAKPAKNSFREAEGLYEFVPHFWNRPAFYTDEPVKWIYDEKGAAIRTYKELLSRITARKLLLRGPGRVGYGRGAGTGCEGVWPAGEGCRGGVRPRDRAGGELAGVPARVGPRLLPGSAAEEHRHRQDARIRGPRILPPHPEVPCARGTEGGRVQPRTPRPALPREIQP